MAEQRPCLLMILDGWGVNPNTVGNAVAAAPKPSLDRLMTTCPTTELICSGEAVGLPPGIMGNSEVGHLNIGAGRIVYQDLLRIDRAIAERTFFDNEALLSAIEAVRTHETALHLMGLVSDGGVHSQITHLFALLQLAAEKGLRRVYVHVILDGRDTPPDGGVGYVEQLQVFMRSLGVGRIASICGRYFAMDRDTRWDRTEKAYRLYTRGEGVAENDPVAAVRGAYARGETDEFVKPVFLGREDGGGTVGDGDAIVFFNFRADRARQITRAFTDPAFSFFGRPTHPALATYICMTLYDESFSLPMAFPPVHLSEILGEVVSRAGLRQLRIAETEKYAHVTYFFNGGEETPFPLEDRCLIPSPRDVATYDQKPEMSALAVTEEVLARINSDAYDFIVLNFANMDMVGHTGVQAAAVQAVQTVDGCVGRIVSAIADRGGCALITADHGNAEQMLDAEGGVHTAHTLNPVPLILVDSTRKNIRLRKGILGDIAPTVLELLGLPQPAVMTGKSLIEEG